MTPSETISPTPTDATAPSKFQPTASFWLVFLAICGSCFLSALDLTSVSTALPTIAADLKSEDYSWVGSSYSLTSTALVPFTGSLAAIFGGRATMLASLLIFALGSGISGASPSMNILILGRSIQGIGGGGILVMTEIVVVDLVPLASRGAFYGIIGSVWALSSAIGSPLGGVISNRKWRWMFYMNLPICAIAILLVYCFLNVKTPEGSLKNNLCRLDLANALFMGEVTSLILGLTFGGSTFPWSSWQVLTPIVVGIVSLALFLIIEKMWIKYPTVPYGMLNNRTTLSGYFGTFIHGITVLAAVYYLPVYFQSTKGASAIISGTDMLSLSLTIAPIAIFTGVSVTLTGHYKYQSIVGWAISMIGLGLLSLLREDSGKAAWIGYLFVFGIGSGLLYTSTNFAVVAPLRPDQHPQAMAFFSFVRRLGQVFGISIGSTVLQNGLSKASLQWSRCP